MNGFFQTAVPPIQDILLIESGSQGIFRRGLEGIRRSFPDARLHLLTCWPDPPPDPMASIHRVRDYASRREKLRLLGSFRKKPADVLAILCSNEPIMFSWKMLALAFIPSKTLIINENGDFFWLDWQNLQALRRFLQARWRILGQDFLQTVLLALIFPFTVLFLLTNTLRLYMRRWRRLLLWSIRGQSNAREGTGPTW
jgi:hypothetical protein